LDDLLARSVARGLGVKLTGTAGILINAKMKGLIEAISPYLDQLERLGFHLAPEHKSLILKKAGEE
jgi:predicted nucleic acid-binding protein